VMANRECNRARPTLANSLLRRYPPRPQTWATPAAICPEIEPKGAVWGEGHGRTQHGRDRDAGTDKSPVRNVGITTKIVALVLLTCRVFGAACALSLLAGFRVS